MANICAGFEMFLSKSRKNAKWLFGYEKVANVDCKYPLDNRNCKETVQLRKKIIR